MGGKTKLNSLLRVKFSNEHGVEAQNYEDSAFRRNAGHSK